MIGRVLSLRGAVRWLSFTAPMRANLWAARQHAQRLVKPDVRATLAALDAVRAAVARVNALRAAEGALREAEARFELDGEIMSDAECATLSRLLAVAARVAGTQADQLSQAAAAPRRN